jgi:flagellar basal-body rod protein FlgB
MPFFRRDAGGDSGAGPGEFVVLAPVSATVPDGIVSNGAEAAANSRAASSSDTEENVTLFGRFVLGGFGGSGAGSTGCATIGSGVNVACGAGSTAGTGSGRGARSITMRRASAARRASAGAPGAGGGTGAGGMSSSAAATAATSDPDLSWVISASGRDSGIPLARIGPQDADTGAFTMTNLLRDQISLHAEALKIGERRGALLASNIAQASTPGYKARDIDFAAELARRTGAAGTLSATHARHIAHPSATGGEAGYRVPTTASLDGNTVEPAVEQVQFAENALRQQASLTFLNRRISGLMSAIRGE